MSSSSESLEERIRGEAADWFALLRGEPTAAERAAFDHWLEIDPAHRLAYERLNVQWESAIFLGGAPAVRARSLGSVRSRAGAGKLYAGLAIAAALALALAITVVGGTERPAHPASPLAYDSIGSGERSLRLADGSGVKLAPDSRIEVMFGDRERRVALLRGRARFTVARDASRPFAVAAGGGAVVALGTVFEVAIVDRQVRIRGCG